VPGFSAAPRWFPVTLPLAGGQKGQILAEGGDFSHARLLLLTMFLLPAVFPLFCQSLWAALRELSPGQKIVVVETNVRRLEGKFIASSDDALILDVKVTCPRCLYQ
jgi:hypothetical protein